MKTVLEIVNLSTDYLQKKGIKSPRRQAQELISDCLGLRPLDLYMQFDRPLNEEELDICRSRLQRRAKGEPLQYIRGEVDFYDCKISVTPSVLIPRQETEILADMICQNIAADALEGKVLWDICCGSGCIGIALKKKYPQLKVVMCDLSDEACKVSQINAGRNQVEVEIVKGDLLAPFAGRMADYVICNPPYISDAEYADLEPEVRDYEPKMALVAKEEGLEFYKKLNAELPRFLNPGAKVWLEIGFRQGGPVKNIFSGPFWKGREILRDWAGHDRFFFLEIE